MSAGGKVTKVNKEKTAKVIPSSQNGKVEATQANIRNQPTAEQIRLAQLTSDRSDGDPEIDKKVTQITELTGRTSDEALTALYDCDYDVNRAVEKMLESQGDEVDEWREIGKKKKVGTNKGSPTDTQSDLRAEKLNEQDMDQLNHTDNAPRGRRDRAPPRFNRGRGRGGYNGPDRTERSSRENTSREREQGFDSSRGRRRGNFSETRGRGGRRGGRSMHSNKFETQIDTWTNDSAQNGDKEGTIGAWTDVTDEWTSDEWNGSLKESCVFTPSASRSAAMYSGPNDASEGKSASSVHQTLNVTYESTNQQTTQLSGSSGDATAGAIERTSFSAVSPSQTKAVVPGQDSLNQQYGAKEPAVGKMAADCYGNVSDRTMYVSHYNKEATECIKNVMGIGRSNLTQNAPNADELSQQPTVNQPLNNLQQQQQQQQQSLQMQRARQPRPRLPPPSKIPSMPVEMPDSVNSGRVDVQFGNWDVGPLATDSSISFMSDIVPTPEYIGTSLISSSQSSSVSGTSIVSQPTAASFESAASKSSLATQDVGVATQASKPSPHSNVAAPSSTTNESLLTKVVSISPSSSGLLTSVAKPSGSTATQLGFNQLAYSSSPADGMASTGPKLPMANGPSHYGSYNYQGGSASLVTMSSDYNLAQGQMQYAYGDASQQRFGVNSPQAQPGFGPASLPPGYSSGPLPNQLHYTGQQQGPMKQPFHGPEKPSGSYSIGNDITVLYQSVADKQGASFPAALSQPYDASTGYQSGAGFQSGNQPNSASLPYPGVASGISFQGLSMESGGFEAAGQYQNQSVYNRAREGQGQASYDLGGADSQRSIPTSGVAFSAPQGPASQSFSSSYGAQAHGVQSSSGASYGAGGPGPSQAPPSAGASSFSGQGPSAQAPSVTYGSQGQGAPASGSYGNQRQVAPSAGASAFGNHGQSSQLYGNQGQAAAQGATTQSQLTANLVSSNANASAKLVDNLSKLSMKDGQPGDSAAVSMPGDGTSASSAGNTMMPSSNSGVASAVAASTTNLPSKTSLATTAKSVQQTSKPLINIPPGMPGSAAAAAAAAAMVNPNYMIGQPPGFQLAAFSYPATQQPLTYTSYEELQMMQQRFQMPTPYYDMPMPTSATMPSRESSASLGVQSYAGNDMKLTAMDVLSPVNAQTAQQQQQQQVTGNQQAYINHALHPAYSYYYPGTGIMPVPSYYAQMVPMAIPSVTNPALAGTTSTTQYQKPAVYGSHGYALGGQTQDFSKTFGGSQIPNKPNAGGMASGIGGTSGDMMTGAGAFGKTHMQAYERGGFHAGTPPPSFSMALPSAGGNQAGALGGAPAVYGPPYMPLVQHQQSHSQLLHHAIPQDSAIAGGRVNQPTVVQPKVGGNKPYGNTYWGSN